MTAPDRVSCGILYQHELSEMESFREERGIAWQPE